MCRLFGLLGSPVTPAEEWLVTTDHSLLAQSHASPETAQTDGWGIAWFPSTRTPRVEKGVGGAYEATERDRFVASAKAARGPVVIGHLRHASNPMKLPPERLIGLENSQPFRYGSILFAHNGSIMLPRETRPLLGRFEENVQGVNDSEVLFWLLVRHTEETGDPVRAYALAVDELTQVWRENGTPPEGPYTGLNVLFSRGPNELWAFCHWNGEHGGGLMDPTRKYYQMAYAADAKQAIIGSEPFDTTRSDWRNLNNGEYLQAQVAHGLVAVRTGPIPRNDRGSAKLSPGSTSPAAV
jgi:predicted glutamine amidotransferase